MESQDRKPRKRREREEIGGQVLANNLIGEIDRLEKVGEQAERTAAMYGRMFEDIKSTVLKVDTATLDAKTEEFADALEQQAKRVRTTVRALKGAMWLLIGILLPRSPAVGSPVEISSDDNACPRRFFAGTGVVGGIRRRSRGGAGR